MDKENKNRNEDKKCQIEPESFQLEKQPIKSSLSGIQDWSICGSASVNVCLLA